VVQLEQVLELEQVPELVLELEQVPEQVPELEQAPELVPGREQVPELVPGREQALEPRRQPGSQLAVMPAELTTFSFSSRSPPLRFWFA
jgi:hypothetical protein